MLLILSSTISTWWHDRQKIVGNSSRQQTVREVFVCQWLKMEENLFQAVVRRRDEGKTMQKKWFRETSKRLFQEFYPELSQSLSFFCFSTG